MLYGTYLFSTQGEAHLVHVNSKYADINEAVGKSDGLLVIGFFLDFDARKTPKTTQAMQSKILFQPAKTLHFLNYLQNWPRLISRVKDAKKTKRIVTTDFEFWKMIKSQDVDLDAFWNYQGSLTTPTCNPVVEWIVMKDHLSLSPKLVKSYMTFYTVI